MTTTRSIESLHQSTGPESALKAIVVATDFSEAAYAALHWATALAQTHGAQVVLVHAIETDLPALAKADEPIARHVHRKLEMGRRRLRARKLAVQTQLGVGKPWEVIASAAKKAKADLIVVGAHGRSTFSERVIGTVADRLIRTTTTPVVVHRGLESKAGFRVRTVLAATDFSEEAALAISTVVRLLRASPEPTRLVLFHAIEPLIKNYDELSIAASRPEYWGEAERAAARQLETFAASVRSDQLGVEVKTARGAPAEAILHEAELTDADLIALGTVGRTSLNRFFIGSVAERVLHHAKCPILAVRRPGPDEPVRLSVE